MSTLLGPNGSPISSADFKKAAPPKTGDAFGPWAGRDVSYATLPGGGIVQFDLSKLTLSDYRSMRDHYQVNASLAVLSFMQHQSDWHIECDDKKLRDLCTDMLQSNWTQLNRSMSTANWSGYSPNVLEWDNVDRAVTITKVKDLIPEECAVNWKQVEGWAPPNHIKPKFKKYDGIKQFGQQWPTPVENSFWYPMLMENGDYYGRKLLRPAFQSWFFSILVHLFANRYYERFGEPTPIGRAPFDEDVVVDGKSVSGNSYMLTLLQQLRNRSVVVLPSDKSQGSNGNMDFDYTIEYLESQMRGADFERYLTRLDEEISIGLFTPILLLRTADVGSYNLGVGHMQMYLWMLNAMNADRKQYIDNYMLSPMADYNSGVNASRPKIIFRKLGNTNSEMIQSIMLALVNKGMAKPDIQELGELAGMTLSEIQQTTADNTGLPGAAGVPDPNTVPGDGGSTPGTKGGQTGNDSGGSKSPAKSAASGTIEVTPFTVADEICSRVRPQVQRAFEVGEKDWAPDFGYHRKMATALSEAGVYGPLEVNAKLFSRLDMWTREVSNMSDIDASTFMTMFTELLHQEVKRAIDGQEA
jgi:hypothetical protein